MVKITYPLFFFMKDFKIDHKIPKHVAIIMDGNGRWAKQKGELRVFGHTNGVDSVREALTAAVEIGVEYLHSMLLVLRIGTDRKKK